VWIVHAVMVGVLALLVARRMGKLRIGLRRR
jgi:hypothetical protein